VVEMVHPDIVSLKKVTGNVTATAVAAGGSKDVTITLNSNQIVVGLPYVSTDTADAEVIVINGKSGGNGFVVRAYNNGASDQDVAIAYEVYVMGNV